MSQLENSPETKGDAAVRFRFEGRSLDGFAGESIAAALFRHGIRTLSWSIKFHRPRSIFCGRGRCSMCQVEVDGRPGVKACTTPLRDGMDVCRQNFRPWYAPILTAAVRLLPFRAGFYFRSFTRPAFVRRMFLGSLRRMAGVGRIVSAEQRVQGAAPRRQERTAFAKPTTPAPIRLASDYDVVVVGAGLSGMQAALEAEATGRSVLLVDEYAAPGGHRLGHQAESELRRQRDTLCERVAASRIDRQFSSTVQGVYLPDRLTIAVPTGHEDHSLALETVRAGAMVFATGAYDVVPLFENNDTPGVFGTRGLRLFLERDGIQPGSNALVYGTPDLAREALGLLRAHGIGIAAVATTPASERFEDVARTVIGARLARVRGRSWVRSAELVTEAGTQRVTCDLVCVALPGQPAFELLQQAGFRFSFRDASGKDGAAAGRPEANEATMVPTTREIDGDGCRFYVVGEAAGFTDWREALEQAVTTGRRAAGGV